MFLSRFPPRAASASRFAAPHWPSACRFPCPLLLSVNPPPGYKGLALDPLLTATLVHSPRRAAFRCIAKLPGESLARASTSYLPCSRPRCSAPPDTFATTSNQIPARLRSAPPKIIDTVQATWEVPGTRVLLQTAPASSPF